MHRPMSAFVAALFLFSCAQTDLNGDAEPEKRSPIKQEWIDPLLNARSDCEDHIKYSGVLLRVDEELQAHWAHISYVLQNTDRRDTIIISLSGAGSIILKPLHFKIDTVATHFGLGFDGGKNEAYYRNPLEDSFRVEETTREGVRDYYRCEFGETRKFLFEEVDEYEGFKQPVVPGTIRQITVGARPLPSLVEAQSPGGGWVIQHCESDGGADRQVCSSIIADASAIDQVVPPVETQSSMLDFRSWSTSLLDEVRGR